MASKRIKLEPLATFFDTTRQTIARWRNNKEVPALNLTEQYLDDNSINEFIKTGSIAKLDNIGQQNTPLNLAFEKINQRVKTSFENIKNPYVKEIYKLFSVQTNYMPMYPDMNDYFRNIKEEKDYFYDCFSTFLYKNKPHAYFSSSNRNEAHEYMYNIGTELYMFYFYRYISSLRNA